MEGGETWVLRCMHPVLILDVLGYWRFHQNTGRSDADGRAMATWSDCWDQVEENI